MNLVSMIDSSVRKFPDKPIVAGDRSFTYAEAAEASRHVAGWLAEQDVGRSDDVAIMTVNVPEVVIAMLGIWRFGATWSRPTEALRRRGALHRAALEGEARARPRRHRP